MQELAYMNGTIMPIDEAKVPIEDRGYNFGDAVYEYIASYQGKLVYLEEHLDRLDRSMTALSFPKMSRDMIRRAILELFEQSGIQRAGIYLQISRSVAPRDHAYPDEPQPQFMMTVRPVHEKPPSFAIITLELVASRTIPLSETKMASKTPASRACCLAIALARS